MELSFKALTVPEDQEMAAYLYRSACHVAYSSFTSSFVQESNVSRFIIASYIYYMTTSTIIWLKCEDLPTSPRLQIAHRLDRGKKAAICSFSMSQCPIHPVLEASRRSYQAAVRAQSHQRDRQVTPYAQGALAGDRHDCVILGVRLCRGGVATQVDILLVIEVGFVFCLDELLIYLLL